MKIRLSTKLFIGGVAIVIIAAISVAIYNVKNNPESFIETSKDKNNYNNCFFFFFFFFKGSKGFVSITKPYYKN